MNVELWFLATLIMAQLYDLRAGPKFEQEAGPEKLGLGSAIVALISIAVAGLVLHKFDLTQMSWLEHGELALTLAGATLSYRVSHLGLKHWFSQSWWERPSHLIAGLLTLCFFAKPTFASPEVFNNTLLVFFAVGLGCYTGRIVTRPFAYFFYTLLFVFDIYAVWFSDIMANMIDKAPQVVPTGFIIMASVPYTEFLGAGDVIFAAMGAMVIKHHAGWKWSLAACGLYVLSLYALHWNVFLRMVPDNWLKLFVLFPVMVTICPITIACLFFGSRK